MHCISCTAQETNFIFKIYPTKHNFLPCKSRKLISSEITMKLVRPLLSILLVFNVTDGYNVVIFLANNLGHNDVSWNNDKVLTPNLDQLAQDGKVN